MAKKDKYAEARKKIETSIATSNLGSHMGYVGASLKKNPPLKRKGGSVSSNKKKKK